MSAKFHVNPSTGAQGKCSARTRPCPHGGESGTDNHFDTAEEAQAFSESMLSERFSPLESTRRKKPRKSDAVATDDPSIVARKGRKMTEQEAFLRDSLREMSERLVETRAEVGDVTIESANPERAKRRLREALEFADSRGNSHLMKKLTGASVLPSGAFRLADGSRYNMDKLIANKQALNHVDSERAKVLGALTTLAQSSDSLTVGTPYKFANNDVSISATIKDGALDEDAFNALPADVRKQISKQESKVDIDLVREHISPEKQSQIMSTTQVFDTIIGKPKDFGADKVQANTQFTGNSDTEKFNNGLSSMGQMYSDAKEAFGGNTTELKKRDTEASSAIKALSQQTNPNRNTFVPARSQLNGGVVTGRQNLSPSKFKDVLTSAEIAKIQKVTTVPDRVKAEAVLSKADFDRIFNNRVVSARVTNKK